MTTKIYRPSAAGGELQYWNPDGNEWLPIYGVSGITVSGGDRETSTFETLDGGVESTFGQAGVKDIALTLAPSFMNVSYRRIVDEAYYGEDVVRMRYRTLANSNPVAEGVGGNTVAIAAEANTYGEGVVTFAGDGASNTAREAVDELSELGLHLATKVAGTESKPAAGKFFIVRKKAAAYVASQWDGSAVPAVAANAVWTLMRFGIAFEFQCRAVTAGNPELAVNSAINETLNLRQTASGWNFYPITKAAA